ncbi:MAG: superoxide dismutase family protein [Salegentibacter sp.]|uniref:Superoxide dismutase [Cu-Zn] n=1 Tax=Salegentibacter flavus TaxID=287099 RepID=A0A1I4YND5_9FLAO|nr:MULTISPECIES: superoxide dismutase family protein [Salegentibacter]MDR9456062.1 superoxide dismutase family protein [Salegentibacter sp.]SFN39534.1 superoxide dismutase, Cu-Zn family [Salegentibacter flavus]
MKRISLSLVIFASIAIIGCKNDKKEEDKTTTDSEMNSTMDDMEEENEIRKATATMSPNNNSNLGGEVVFTQENGEVSMTALITGLPEGEHAIHIHEFGDCSMEDGSSAGGHWNPTDEKHGKWGDPEGYHKGDIGNFTTDSNGNGTITMTTDEWCIGCGDEEKDILGKSIIVHDGVDDFTSQPAGNAGTRVGCGVIEE